MDTHYERLNRKLDKQNTTTHNPQRRHLTTYPRTVNLTGMQLTDEEQKLLDLGLQYSMQRSRKSTWTNLVLETEHAIRLLDDKPQSPFRIIVTKKLKQLYNTNHQNTIHRRQLHILKQINQKITSNNTMITRADKGKTTVIIYIHTHTHTRLQ